jgi:hypothetical protein
MITRLDDGCIRVDLGDLLMGEKGVRVVEGFVLDTKVEQSFNTMEVEIRMRLKVTYVKGQDPMRNVTPTVPQLEVSRKVLP